MLPLDEIRADIAAFADNEEDVIIEGGLILFQRDGQTVECRLSEKPGEPIEVEHSGRTLPYSRFLGEELGRLGVIAQAIKQRREDVKFYVDTQGVLEDAIGREDGSQSALSILRSRCSDRTPGVTNLIFLTADAGDGKSAVLRRLALTAAQDYIDRHANWVLLHIDTHGRSFIRLEEAVAAELGRLRISGVFYSGVLRLVRHGLLVIAVDGFDELLAEVGFGEAYSGLGAFVRQLDGRGVVIAAARSAYFEAENYSAQGHLLASLPGVRVQVEHVRLRGWAKEQTVEYFQKYSDGEGQIPIADTTYNELATEIGEDHVLLHRPFLVRNMAIILGAKTGSTSEVITDMKTSGLTVVPEVIRAFLRREVAEKWRDRNGQSYLLIAQHEELLAAIAEEMWIQGKIELPIELIQLLAETLMDDWRVPQRNRVQITERVKAHALLPTGSTAGSRRFDHDEFLNYFLARRMVQFLKAKSYDLARSLIERHTLPSNVAKWTAHIEPWDHSAILEIVDKLNAISVAELRSTYLKQNAGLIAAQVFQAESAGPGLRFDSMYFEGGVWANSSLHRSTFRRCVFVEVDIRGVNWGECEFGECDIQGITLDENTKLERCKFSNDCRVVGAVRKQGGGALRTYVPELCQEILKQHGAEFTVEEPQQLSLPGATAPEEIRAALEAFLRIFFRNSGAIESVIKMRLGVREGLFNRAVLPKLLEHNIARETDYRGRGSQKRYELLYSVDKILAAENPRSPEAENLRAFWASIAA